MSEQKETRPELGADPQGQLEAIVMRGVVEYTEELPVELVSASGRYDPCKEEGAQDGFGRMAIRAESGYGSVEIDLEQLLRWTAANMPALYQRCAA